MPWQCSFPYTTGVGTPTHPSCNHLLGSCSGSHLCTGEIWLQYPWGPRETSSKAVERSRPMVFHRKSSQKVYSRFPFLGQDEQQTGHLSGSEQEQCHLSYTAGPFRVQHRAGGGQCGSFSLLSAFPKFHGDKNHLGAGGVNVWIPHTHPQALLSDCASEGLGWDAG